MAGYDQAVTSLKDYERKRTRGRTPEPFGQGRRRKEPVFVVQRHDARRLHYDFRLERDGVLLSWAVPKGVPLEPGTQHLAVHVEDHPLSYATFEGDIPAGNYGAGTVEIWDHGTYELVEEKPNGGLTVRLHGERLNGLWTLVPAKLGGDPKNWLIVKKKEDAAPARKPRAYKPMLATLTDSVPAGGEWLHEVKWDGYRAIVTIAGGEAELTSRNGNSLTGRFPTVAKALEQAVKTPDCVLDGEVCALDERGRTSFSAMQQGSGPLVIYVFDVLEVEGEPVIDLPFTERRERLVALLDRRNKTVRLSEAFDDGEALYAAVTKEELEGIVSKKADSVYTPGKRSREWLKVKTQGRQEFVVVGYTKGQGRRSGRFGSLVLAVTEAGGLRWVGNVGTGFDDAEIEWLLQKLKPLRRETSPFAEVPKMPRVKKGDVVWVEPELVAEIRFAEWTHDGRLRAPVYVGLREDKEAEEVHREREAIPPEIRKGKRVLKLSNLDKLYWPDEGITKGDLLAYYRDVAPAIVPHLKNRPFTMKRYPDGWKGKFFFQKDAPKHMPDWIPTARFEASTRDRPPQRRMIDFPLVNDELALLWMVNMGCIDMNTWYSRVDKPSRPDWVLFDLDPSPDVGFPETIQVALLIKETLDLLGLTSFPKTSGSEGIHVLVPIARRHTYSETREFSEIVAGAIARAHPGLATTEWTKAKRRGVLIDSNQNGEGKTIASVYSVRPKAGAPVSTPVRWDEVNESLDPAAFTMDAVLDRIGREGDLFEGVLTTKQSLGEALRSVR
ncbi:MAG: bifunctional non-ous end joining protein LigD [Gaiellaceae bacterium]|nr:bifunctional non-ous end joining protein LigD [Gaiellaceae bacterium]